MDVKVRIGFIGAGCVNFGGPDGPWDHASRLETMPQVLFVGIVDPNKERSFQVLHQRQGQSNIAQQRLWKDCQIFTNLQEMIDTVRPHVVFIGVPPFCHGSSKVPMELQCAEAGIHCFIEKPLSNATARDTLEFATKVQAKPVILSVGYMFRHSQWVKYIQRTIQEHGKPIVCFNAQYTCAYANCNSPFWWNTDYSGGPIVEQATHFIDLARFIVGEVQDATIQGCCVFPQDDPDAVGSLEAIPIDESTIPMEKRIPRSTVINWRFESGAVGSLVHNALLQGNAYDARLEILADGLRIRVEEPYSTSPRLHVLKGKMDKEEIIEFPQDDPYYTEDMEFIDSVRQQLHLGTPGPITCDFVDGAKTYALSYKMRQVTTTP